MGRWYFYDLATGKLDGRSMTGPDGLVALNTPPGYGAVQVDPDAQVDRHNRRVNLATGVLEAYHPPAPPDDELRRWAWDETAERWQPRPTDLALQQQRDRELQMLLQANEQAQARPQRELLLALAEGRDAPPEAVARLADIEASATQLRAELAANRKR